MQRMDKEISLSRVMVHNFQTHSPACLKQARLGYSLVLLHRGREMNLGQPCWAFHGGSMADGQHIPAVNPMGKGVCMHVGNPCSFSVPYLSGQSFPVPVRTWHSRERKNRYGGGGLPEKHRPHSPLSQTGKSDGKKAAPL